METIKPSSTWNEPPTDAQIRAITRFCMILNIKTPLEETPYNRTEARNLIYQLLTKLKAKHKNKIRRNS